MRHKLIKARNSINLTQKKVAEQSDITRSYYNELEQGKKKPSLEVAFRVAEVVSSKDISFEKVIELFENEIK